MNKAYIPNPLHEILLKASLWKGEEGLRCYEKWKNSVDFRDIDYASTRVIPLLYKNLLSQGVKDPIMPRLKGIYRYSWANNQNILAQMPLVIKIFKENNIPCLFVKGSGLTLLCYAGDMGVRAMTDLDVLVSETHIDMASQLLEKSGWKPDVVLRQKMISVRHAVHYKFLSGADLDLHWHLLSDRTHDKYDQLFWQKITPITFQNQKCNTLCPTDHLIHNCLHGARWEDTKTIRWISDAYTLIEKFDIDWNHVVTMSRKLELILPLGDMLQYLKTDFRADIPESVLNEMKQLDYPSWQKKEYELISQPMGFFGVIPLLWLRSTYSAPFFKKIPAFLKYLKSWYSVESYFHLGILFLKKGKDKIMMRYNQQFYE